MSFLLGFLMCFVCWIAVGAIRLRRRARRYANDTCAMSETTVAVVRDGEGRVRTYAH